jgi:hypothetical protein
MQLTNFEIADKPEVDMTFLMKGDYGKQRVLAAIPRIDLDDYFEKSWPSLTDTDRRTLLEGNADIIAAHMQRKCEAGEWKDENRFGSTVKRIEISRDDLFSGPRLTDARLKMQKEAGFKPGPR